MLILGIFIYIALVILFAANFIVRIQVLSVLWSSLFLKHGISGGSLFRMCLLTRAGLKIPLSIPLDLSLHPTRYLSSLGGYSLLDFLETHLELIEPLSRNLVMTPRRLLDLSVSLKHSVQMPAALGSPTGCFCLLSSVNTASCSSLVGMHLATQPCGNRP